MTVTWRDHPQYAQGYLFLLRPRVVFQAEMDFANTFIYGRFGDYIYKLLYFETPTIGDSDASTVKPGMTLVMGDTPGADNYGRARVRYVTTEGYTGNNEKVISVWVSSGDRDGELYIHNGTTYITVWDDYRVWAKMPYYADNANQYFDGDLYNYNYLSYNMLPVANAGPGYAEFVDPATGLITVSFSGAGSYATAYGAYLGTTPNAFPAGCTATADTSNGGNTPDKAIDGSSSTYWESTTTYGWIQVVKNTPVFPREYTIKPSAANTAPTVWQLWGDDTVLLDERVFTSWVTDQSETFVIDRFKDTAFSSFKWIITNNNGGATLRIKEIDMWSEVRTGCYAWDVVDGSITVGNSGSEAITATFPRGFRWVELTVEHNQADTNFCHVPVFAAAPQFTRELTDYSGITVTGSSEVVGHEDDDAFDGDRFTYWQTDETKTATLQAVLDSPRFIRAYGLVPSANGEPPRDWTFEYQNADSGNWVVLDTQEDQDWTPVEVTATGHGSGYQTGTAELGHEESTVPAEASYAGASFSESGFQFGSDAQYCFDNTEDTGWVSNTTTGWIQVQFASSVTCTAYRVQGDYGTPTAAPKNWTFQGSNNGTDWTTLDTQTNQTGWSAGEVRTYTLAGSVTYTHYRLNITANNGHASFVAVYELDIMAITVIAVPNTRLLQIFHLPARARIVGATAYLAKVGACTATLTPTLYTLAGREPDVLLNTGHTIDASSLGGGADIAITFDHAVWLDAGTYALVLDTDTSGSAYVTWSCDNLRRYIGGGLRAYNSGAWGDVNADAIFSIVTEDERIFELSIPVESDTFRLNITDSNHATHIELAEFNLYEEYDAPITNFEIINHRHTLSGQEITFRVHEDIDLSQYPDGTLVMYWEREVVGGEVGSLPAAGPAGREHMKFIGWIDTEPTRVEANEYDTRSYVDLQCVDVGGRLQRLPAFPLLFERETAPAYIYQMKNANIDRFIAALVLYFTTAAEVADFTWTGMVDFWAFSILSSEGGTLFNAIDNRASAIGYALTCDKHGRLWVKPDPLLLYAPTSAVIIAINETDWVALDHTRTRPPRYYQLWSSAVAVNRTDADLLGVQPVYFTVAPGFAPGQGAQTSEKNEILTPSIGDLTIQEGYRYRARLNPHTSVYKITLAHGADTGIDPAKREWIELTSVPDARGQSLASARFLPLEVTYTYDHTTLTRQATVTAERPVDLVIAAVGYIPP